jgi:hypothetical protein
MKKKLEPGPSDETGYAITVFDVSEFFYSYEFEIEFFSHVPLIFFSPFAPEVTFNLKSVRGHPTQPTNSPLAPRSPATRHPPPHYSNETAKTNSKKTTSKEIQSTQVKSETLVLTVVSTSIRR